MSDTNECLTTAAREAIRIADKYLPFATVNRRYDLAREIAAACALCEEELGDEIIKRIKVEPICNKS